jgi:hypothetical protein
VKCKRRGCRNQVRPKINPAVKGVALRARLMVDPYCSRACCEADNGVDGTSAGFYVRDYTKQKETAA